MGVSSENSSVGRARPCQGRGRGFESRLSLQDCSSGGIGRHAGLKILWAFARAGSSPASSTETAPNKWGFCYLMALDLLFL